jgi:hypothetical protein
MGYHLISSLLMEFCSISTVRFSVYYPVYRFGLLGCLLEALFHRCTYVQKCVVQLLPPVPLSPRCTLCGSTLLVYYPVYHPVDRFQPLPQSTRLSLPIAFNG